jgi:hypothetical protein
MPPLSIQVSSIPVSLSAPDAFRQDPASLNGKRDWIARCSTTFFSALTLILFPGALSVAFMVWVLCDVLQGLGQALDGGR